MPSISHIHNDFVVVDCNDSARYTIPIECPLASWDEVHIMPIRANLGNTIHFYARCSLVNDAVIGYFRGDSAYQPNYPVIFKNQRMLGSFRNEFTLSIHKLNNTAIAGGEATGQIAFYCRFIKYAPTYDSIAESKDNTRKIV